MTDPRTFFPGEAYCAAMELDQRVIVDLQASARERAYATDLARLLCVRLNLGPNDKATVAAYFEQALGLSASEAAIIGTWNFFTGGKASDSDVDAKLKPIFLSKERKPKSDPKSGGARR